MDERMPLRAEFETPSPVTPPLKPGTDPGVYDYLRRRLEEVPAVRAQPNDDPRTRKWRLDTLYNVGVFFGPDSPEFALINVFEAIDPKAFVSEERRIAMYEARHHDCMDRLAEGMAQLLRRMEA